MDRYFHDAQWVRKHWDLDIDFDTDSEEDATFGKYLSSDSLEKEESPVKVAAEQQPILDEEDRLVQGGAQGVSEEDCDVLSEEANHGVCMEMREPAFSDRSIFSFGPSQLYVCVLGGRLCGGLSTSSAFFWLSFASEHSTTMIGSKSSNYPDQSQ